tara:strand:+ start:235907 stop:236968 length:1062 start_codon:yes stop_codon:yes gene_type:complete
MKALFLVYLALISSSTFAGWASGGGDPKEVKVKPFPNQKVLSEAIELLKKKVNETPLHQKFKEAFIEDLELMKSKKRFYYIPKLFAVGFNRYGGDYTKLVSNGAMTEFEKGGAIYFSKRARKYDAKTLARVIAQEVPHHIFRGKFQYDEVFANSLGTYLIVGGEIPTKPYPAAQIIHEEFDHDLRDKSSLKVINKARKKYADNEDVLEVLYYLSHELYKLRGAYLDYHVESTAPITKEMMNQRFPRNTRITHMPKLREQFIKKCVFVKYSAGPSGISEVMSEKLTKTFLEHLHLFKNKIKDFYLVEDFYLPATKVITDCGIAIEDNQGEVYIYKAVRRHEDNQGPPPSPFPTI